MRTKTFHPSMVKRGGDEHPQNGDYLNEFFHVASDIRQGRRCFVSRMFLLKGPSPATPTNAELPHLVDP